MWGSLSRARRRENADRERRRQELCYLEFLRDEIFAKPDIARMYWHTRHPRDLQVLHSTDFGAIADVLRPTKSIGPSTDDTLADLIRDFFDGLSEDDRAHLVRNLDVVFRSFERSDLAGQLDALEIGQSQKAEA
ncbi:hypothetical protein ACQP2E_12840 [Actinoplanes sp. CA-015351]|uniref:hypothetical protein n=1 Tax=Actinoplanes sp. CA-015351 TaxID=3239897 RepID=UPI003D973556